MRLTAPACRLPSIARKGLPYSSAAPKEGGAEPASGNEGVDTDKPKPHEWQPDHLRLAVTAAGVALWAWNVDSDQFTMDERGFELWGMKWTATVTFEELSSHIHPADRDRVRAAFAATRAVLGSYETDFRILIGEEIRWIAARGQGEDVGIVGRTMFGIFLDVTGRKQAEEGHELLAGEMSHRVKNLLAIAAGLTRITSRSAKSARHCARLTSGGRRSAAPRSGPPAARQPGRRGVARRPLFAAARPL